MKQKRLIPLGISALLLIALLISCSAIDPQNPGDYLSISVSYEQVPFDEATGYYEYAVSVYDYDLQSKELSEIYRFPYNTQYALGVYDKKENAVYYTKEKNNDTYERLRTGDQIYAYDLATGTDTMLTEDLFAVNYLAPVEDALFFVAAKMSYIDGLALGKINLSDGSIQYWDEADSASVQTISIDKVNQRLYVSVFDWNERHNSMIAGNRDGFYIPPRYTIYSFDYNLSDKREVLHKDTLEINAVYARDNWLLYRTNGGAYNIEEVVDLSNMEVLFQVKDHFKSVGNFTRDKKGVYTKTNASGFDGICYYDFETEEFTTIVTIDDTFQEMFLNFQVMYYE